MTRALTTAIKNQLATNDIRPVHLITIGFGTPVNITDCSFSLTSSVSGSSVTYSASDFILGVSEFDEQVDITKGTLNLTLSGANTTFISVVLNENVINDDVTIFRGLLDNNNALIADPIFLYKGKIDGFDINENNTASTVNLKIVSHWADFDKESGRRTNNTSQQRFFSSDVGFDFASEMVQDIKWGKG
mgnify:CR=1 FL=1|tara:strand:+ start:3227 stop:3793 length:567 start_codon:yes stop_codon:yes gene_type:complete